MNNEQTDGNSISTIHQPAAFFIDEVILYKKYDECRNLAAALRKTYNVSFTFWWKWEFRMKFIGHFFLDYHFAINVVSMGKPKNNVQRYKEP